MLLIFFIFNISYEILNFSSQLTNSGAFSCLTVLKGRPGTDFLAGAGNRDLQHESGREQ